MRNRHRLKVYGMAAKWLFILCLPLLLLTASLGWAVNSLWLYKYGFHTYGVSQATGLADSELEKVATGLIHYFNSDEEYITLSVTKDGESFALFTPEETIHFKDVKGLIRLDYGFLLGTLIYALGYAGICLFCRIKKYRQWLARGVVTGAALTLAFMLALGSGILLNFDRLFLRFHWLFFTNEFWSAEGYMLLLFPQGFWYDTAVLCVGIIVGLAVILGGVGGSYLILTRRKAKL